jgi:hypothetical protein
MEDQNNKLQTRESINDLLVGASNLKIASDICGRMPKSEELTAICATFDREMIGRMREAAALIEKSNAKS